MSNKKLLVTTALPSLLGSSEELYLLGSWCAPFNYEKHLKNRVFFIQPHHWSDSKKKAKDYDYIGDLYERVVYQLSESLNHYHGVNYSNRYWRIVLGPWLISYLPLIWDRWEVLRVAFDSCNKFKIKAYGSDNLPIPSCYDEYSSYFQSDLWNHFIFLDIINYQYNNMVDVEKLDDCCETDFNKGKEKTPTTVKAMIRRSIDSLLSILDFKSKVFFFESQLNIISLLKMSIALRQVPRFRFFDESKYYNISNKKIQRSSIYLNLSTENKFEKYLEVNLIKNLPISIMENFINIRDRVAEIKFDGNIIFTSNAHLHNDVFNIWSAGQVTLYNKKLITSQHGGAIKSSMSIFNHQEKVSDVHVVWHNPIDENHKQLPPLREFADNLITTKKEHLVLVGYETGNYVYNAQSGPCCEHLLSDYNQKIKFIESVDLSIRNSLKVESKSRGLGYFHSMDRYIESLNIEYPKNEGSFNAALKEAKVVVCTYPQTTFSEAMVSGIPTILLMVKGRWPLHEMFSSLVEVLYENNIIFYDHLSAARHLNSIWNNPDEWWNRPSVLKARECFKNECCQIDKNRISIWSEFFKGECSE